MAITANDIKFKYSTKVGGAGNQNTGTAAGSLGKYISTTEITGAQLNNLFDDVTGDENTNGDVEYRCIFIHNAHATLTLTNIWVWSSAEVSGGAVIHYAADPAGSSSIGQSAAQAIVIADEDTAPSGIGTYFSFDTKGLLISASLPAAQCLAIWLRRTAQNTPALNNDGVTLKVEGDTPA
ncbi:hypothetical protein LCGC14_1260050 [marine sediment metagenome]|uniref:Uncharacterized protein n=1 Tax=marine sediment metagenome TaxID=412755 RepID=A0A0F9P4D8_9ZZZZ